MTRKKTKNLGKPLKAPTPADGKFHLIKSEYAANSLSKVLESSQIPEDDKLLIEKHVAWLDRGYHYFLQHLVYTSQDLYNFIVIYFYLIKKKGSF
jgi:hypothetical protein